MTTQRRPVRPAPHPVLPEHYRRRRLAAALVALLALVGLGLTARVVLYDVGLADVEDVRVTGAAAVPVGEVLAAAAVTVGGPLAAVEGGVVAARVAQLPGVESVRVERDWPHTVSVEVTERVPVAVTQAPGGLALVDRSGVVYAGDRDAGLPRLTVGAPGPDDPATLAAVAVLAALPEPVRSQVRTVGVADTAPEVPAQVVLGLTEGRQVRWGPSERMQDKVAVLGPLLGEPGRVYDVTSPDLPTIRP